MGGIGLGIGNDQKQRFASTHLSNFCYAVCVCGQPDVMINYVQLYSILSKSVR